MCFLSTEAQNLKKEESFPLKIIIDTLFEDKISIRSLAIDGNEIWFSADKNRFGTYNLKTKNKNFYTVPSEASNVEFRSCALTNKKIYLLSIASPALLYEVDKKSKKIVLSYINTDKDIFFDSLQFWNNDEGIAFGDPVSGFFNLLITRNAGKTWNKLHDLPIFKTEEGEGAFAASNTNIVVNGNHTWIATGGKKARVFYSSDKAKSWSVVDSPIVQGQAMTGVFSADFYDAKIGCIAGGNYESPNQNFGNKAMTFDGGKTWRLIAENSGPGYISCVQFVPNSKGKELMTVGATGIYYSNDSGNNWMKLSSDPSLYTLRFVNTKTAIAAGKNKLIRISLQK